MKKTISLNVFASMLFQIVTIVSGLIIPKLILNTFGSTINGLVNSINQFLNYIALLEGGVASVMMANLYKPLYNHDINKLSSVINTIKRFFTKLSLVFICYMLFIASVYPLIIKHELGWMFVSSLTVILGINLFVQYCFSYTYKLLLNADNKVYITAFTSTAVVILNTIFVYFGIKLFPSIHFVKLITAILFLLQPLIYISYVRKHYRIDKTAKTDDEALKQRWDGFGINLAAFIHNNTDIVVLSFFSNLSIVSVYSVYRLVISGIKSLIISMMNGIVPTLGKKIAKADKEQLNSFFDNYEFFCMLISYIAFTLGVVLIVPFVLLYTKGVTDADYYQPVFAVIMVLAEACYCIRDPYVNMAYQSGVFKDISKYAYVEAVLNISVSIILVSRFGLIGVAIGTVLSMFYRTVMQVYYLKNHLLNRSPKIFWKYVAIFTPTGLICFYLMLIIRRLAFADNDLRSFVLLCLLSTGIIVCSFLFVSFAFFKKNMVSLMSKRKI